MNGPSIFNQSQASVFCLSVQDRFEREWRRGGKPNLPDFWNKMLAGQPALSAEDRRTLLWRLVEVDLEYRWSVECQGTSKGPSAQPWTLEEYAKQLPELGPLDGFPVDVIAHEYRLRRASDRYPSTIDEYMTRFPNQGSELQAALKQLDSSLPSKVRERPAAGLPERFGRYRIVKRLGEGGMGSVYLAEDTQLRRRVALKVPHMSRDADPRILERFYREAQAAAKLNHPNLCQVFDAGEINGTHYLTMAYIEGKPLAEYIKADRRLPERNVAAVIRKLALALEEAHRQGVIHRDLKPSNVIVNQRKQPVITDFGLARLTMQEDARMTSTGQAIGTPAYMSPEQADGDVEAMGPACDIYSLGVMLYQLLTGRLPFEGSAASVLVQIMTVEPPPPSKFRPDLSPKLEAICVKAMAKKAHERYLSVANFGKALNDYLAHDSRSKEARAGTATENQATTETPADNGAADVFAEIAATPVAGVSIRSECRPQGRLHALWADRKSRTGVLAFACFFGLAVIGVIVTDLARRSAGPNHAPKIPVLTEPTPKGQHSPPQPHNSGTLSSTGPLPRRFTNSLGMEFVLVPKGKSWLGGGGGITGKPVSIPYDFFLGTYEVTQEEWQKVMGSNPSCFSRNGSGGNAVKDLPEDVQRRLPVETVSWQDAQSFLERLNAADRKDGWEYCLPTRMEWEYACRGGPMTDQSQSAFDFYFDKPTNAADAFQANFSWLNLPRESQEKAIATGLRTRVVGSYPANPLGLCDMHGNVWEWCDDQTDHSSRKADASRVRCGGSCFWGPSVGRAAHYEEQPQSGRYGGTGFRVACLPMDRALLRKKDNEKLPDDISGAGYPQRGDSTLAVLDFSDGFVRSSDYLTRNGSAAVRGTILQLTERTTWQAGSVFSKQRLPITRFTSQFSFQLSAGAATASGFTFTIQGNSPTALAGAGIGLGYGPDPRVHSSAGLDKSVAIKFGLWTTSPFSRTPAKGGPGTSSTGLLTHCDEPDGPIDLAPSGIDLHSGHVFHVNTDYDGTRLSVTISDVEARRSATQSYVVDIPATVGGLEAYVGFTAATGNGSATQEILNWKWTSDRTGAASAQPDIRGVQTLVVSRGKDGTCSTLAAALEAAKAGDRILVRPGTYEESVEILKPSIRIEGDGDPNTVVLESSNRMCIGVRASGVEIRGVTLHCRVTGLEPKPNDRSNVIVVGARNVVLRDCDISGGTFCGVDLGRRTQIRLIHCRVHDNRFLGVSAHGEMVCDDCDFFRNGMAGISVWQGKIDITNCRICTNDSYGITFYGPGDEGRIRRSDLRGNAKGAIHCEKNGAKLNCEDVLGYVTPTEPHATRADTETPHWPTNLLTNGKIQAPDLSGAQLLHNVDFADPNTGWPVGKENYGEWGYRDNVYFFKLHGRSSRAWQSGVPNSSNFACQLEGRIRGAIASRWGLQFNSGGTGIRVLVTREGVLLIQGCDSEARKFLDAPIKLLLPPALRSSYKLNKLLVVVRDKYLEVYVNSVAVCQPISLKEPLVECASHIFASCEQGEVVADFKRLTLWSQVPNPLIDRSALASPAAAEKVDLTK